jgi:hypothetical protein
MSLRSAGHLLAIFGHREGGFHNVTPSPWSRPGSSHMMTFLCMGQTMCFLFTIRPSIVVVTRLYMRWRVKPRSQASDCATSESRTPRQNSHISGTVSRHVYFTIGCRSKIGNFLGLVNLSTIFQPEMYLWRAGCPFGELAALCHEKFMCMAFSKLIRTGYCDPTALRPRFSSFIYSYELPDT